MPAFRAQGGMPFWMDLLTTDVRAAANFYGQALGWEISETAPGYRMARAQGLPVAGLLELPVDVQLSETWVTYFLADELEAAVARVSELGGRLLAAPTEVQLGRMALCVDNIGALFGLIEPVGSESFVAGGEPGTPVWHELTCTRDREGNSTQPQAVDFYAALNDWTIATENPGEAGAFRYSTALVEGAPFAGIWDAASSFPAQVPSFWQSYIGVKDLDSVVAKVPELQGEVIRAPWHSEFGRMALVADPTGAALTLCEVAEPELEPHEGEALAGLDLNELRQQLGDSGLENHL